MSDTHSFSIQGGGSGTYGSLIIDGNGDWTYPLNNGAANVQALNTGDQVFDNFVVDVDDGNGGTTTANVSISINGEDDNIAPVANDDSFGQDSIFLNFDDLPTSQVIPTGYGGFDWYANTSTNSNNDLAVYNYGNSYSANNVAIPWYGPEETFIERVDGGDFVFEGAFFGTNQSYVSPITLVGYNDGAVVGTYTFSQPAGNGYQYVAPNLGTIERLEIDSNSGGWWRMDVATFTVGGAGTDEDTARTIDAADLLANDTDADGDVLSLASVSLVAPWGQRSRSISTGMLYMIQQGRRYCRRWNWMRLLQTVSPTPFQMEMVALILQRSRWK